MSPNVYGINPKERLRHRFECFGFVVEHLEYGKELRDLQEILNAAGEVQQLELAALIANSREQTDEFAEPGTIDVIDVGQV